MCLNRLQAPAEVLKSVSLFVHLHSLSIVLDLSIHSIGTFLHSRGNSTTSLSLYAKKITILRLESGLNLRVKGSSAY